MKVFRYFFCQTDSRKVFFDALTNIRGFRRGMQYVPADTGESAEPSIPHATVGIGSS